MSYIRKPSIMEQLFGADVPLWKKLLTLATFPVWGPVVALIALFIVAVLGSLWCIATGAELACGCVDNISDK